MSLRKVVRSASIAVLLAGVAILGSSCAQQKPEISEEKPTAEKPTLEETKPMTPGAPSEAMPPKSTTEEYPPAAPEEGKPGKMKKVKHHKEKAVKQGKHKGKKHGAVEEEAAMGHNKTILAEIQASPSFDTFARVIKAAGLNKMFKTKGPYTLLAPTDAAFAKLPEGTVDRLLKSKRAHLQELVYAHTLKGRIHSSELKNLNSVKTWNGETLKVRGENGHIFVGKARVGKQEINAANGVIHPVNAVFMSRTAKGENHTKSTAKTKQKHESKKPKSEAKNE